MRQATLPGFDVLTQTVNRWQPYPEYKPSGVDWIYEIPAHWDTRRAKFIFRRLERPVRDEDEIVTCYRDGQVTLRSNRRTEGYTFSIQEIGYQGVRRGDLVIHAMDGFAGAVGVSDSDGKCTPVYSVCLPTIPASTYYYAYLIRHIAMSDYITALSRGIRQRSTEFRFKEFQELVLPIPPESEQHSIAAFLDRETAKIDALIAKKERLIELLQEQRAALISHAVTKGLDPSVPMRDSGFEWLGEIPRHWQLLPLRRIVDKFVDYRGKTPEKVDTGIPLITARNIRDGELDFTDSLEFIREEDYDAWMVRGFPETGDVLITTEAPLGATAQITDTYVALAQRIILLKADTTYMTNDFLRYYFLSASGQGELWSRATGSTAVGIKASHLREIMVPVPPIEEQERISENLDRRTERIKAPVTTVREGMKRLHEYRTALISAAVTGKIDVRGEMVQADG